MGACVCAPGWSGDDCANYRGACHAICRGHCSGPTAYECLQCAANGTHTVVSDSGLCECETDWTGETCELYNGHCDDQCLGCSGPSVYDCIRCVPHAGRDGAGACVCMTGYVGYGCETYEGTCYATCALCPRGHTIYDCD